MFSFSPSPDAGEAAASLDRLIRPHLDPRPFIPKLQRLNACFQGCLAACPPPWSSAGLALTPEIHYQSEIYLPLDFIRPAFEQFYRTALSYPPLLSTTPFRGAASWAEVVAGLPAGLGNTVNPATLLQCVLTDVRLRRLFFFWSFMPRRFYGTAGGRYPLQRRFFREWLEHQGKRDPLQCLDAACGDGAESWLLAGELLQAGRRPEQFRMEGWSLEPLEVWAAAHLSHPHDPRREVSLRHRFSPFIEPLKDSLVFRSVDLLDVAWVGESFDLIVCNGLLGGPILHRPEELERVIRNLTRLLRPGGLLLAADNFHGGWKKKIPGQRLGDLFRKNGLAVVEAGEGLGGIRT